jgi:hypothetical protein
MDHCDALQAFQLCFIIAQGEENEIFTTLFHLIQEIYIFLFAFEANVWV